MNRCINQCSKSNYKAQDANTEYFRSFNVTGKMVEQLKQHMQDTNEIQNIIWLFNLKISDKMKVHFGKKYCQDNLL